MRMTNKIMRNNSIYNINQNKILQDQLTNQMTNQSKIVRPSDDPVVAIRALRLRSNVTTITQYNEKNADDADQWLKLTSDAINTIDQVFNHLYEQAETGANKYETSDDLKIILEQMDSLTKEFYSSANVDYAGRYIFSGYRTDTPVTFTQEDILQMEKHPVSFEIEEELSYKQISTINYTNYDVVDTDLKGAADEDTNSYEQQVTNTDLYRFRLSYDALDSNENGNQNNSKIPGEITITCKGKDGKVSTIKMDATGATVFDPATADNKFDGVTMKEYSDPEVAYKKIADGTFTGIAYCPSSGELVFGKDFYDKFQEGDNFTFNYDKSSWVNGDVNPVHYFKCTETKDTGDGTMTDTRETKYNWREKLEGKDQDIYYDVGFNQQIQVNSRADEIFTHNVGRDMDDFDHCIKELVAIETKEKEIKEKMKEFPEDSKEYKDYSRKLEAVEKAGTYIRENIHKKFENQMTKYQQYQADNRVAMTDNATRRSRLELITTRLTSQQATFKELQTDNEGIDVTEVAVELTSSELTYSAALMATSKIMQTNLMNYI